MHICILNSSEKLEKFDFYQNTTYTYTYFSIEREVALTELSLLLYPFNRTWNLYKRIETNKKIATTSYKHVYVIISPHTR